jgi:predicted transcriptional regulator
MDYAMPRAEHMPPIRDGLHSVPATTNPLGVKGTGEAGTTAAIAAVMNAIADAVPGLGICATIRNVTPQTDPETSEKVRMSASMPDLGELEREVMQLIWADGPLTAEIVRERLTRRLKESTVRTVLRRLEEKGYVNHAVDGRTYVYQATHPRGKVAAKAVQRIVDLFCNGSVEEVLVGMVDNAMLDQRQPRALADKVAKAKAGRR